MAQIKIAGLVPKTNKGGITSWYWQPSATLAKAGWKPLTLGKDRGAAMTAAEKRNEEVAEWKIGGGAVGVIKAKPQTGTVNSLVQRYRTEVLQGKHPATGKPRLKPSTAAIYEIALKRIEAWAGKHPIAYVTPARVRALRDANAKPIDQGGMGHSATFNLLKTVRQLFAFAERVDLIPPKSNPATAFELGAPPSRSHIWEAEDEAAFIAAAYDLNRPGLALAIELAIYSGQREGDLIAFSAAQLQELIIHDEVVRRRFAGENENVVGWVFNQAKTSDDDGNTTMEIPLEPTIRKKVEAAIRHNRANDRAAKPPRLLTHVLVDEKTGKPWARRGFITAWREVIEHAAKNTNRPQMSELVWHDLRRTRVVRLRRRGMHPAMIASITGHSLQSINMMLKVYGPVDPTVTAAAIAGTLPDLTEAKAAPAPQQEQSA